MAGSAPAVVTMIARCTSATNIKELKKSLIVTGPKRYRAQLGPQSEAGGVQRPGGAPGELGFYLYWS